MPHKNCLKAKNIVNFTESISALQAYLQKHAIFHTLTIQEIVTITQRRTANIHYFQTRIFSKKNFFQSLNNFVREKP